MIIKKPTTIQEDIKEIRDFLSKGDKKLEDKIEKVKVFSGRKGVHWSYTEKKWSAQIFMNYKYYHIGFFESLEEAIQARQEAEEKKIKLLIR